LDQGFWVLRLDSVGPLKPTPDYRKIAEGDGIKGEFVKSVVGDLLFGHIKAAAEKNGVKSVVVPGYWYDQPGSDIPIGTPPVQGEQVALMLHGGAYISKLRFEYHSAELNYVARYECIQRGCSRRYHTGNHAAL
jgi:hypothetical protein